VRAFVITGPGRAEVREVGPPVAGPGEVIVDVARAGVCGTDVEFFTGEMAYLHTGEAAYPVRVGTPTSAVRLAIPTMRPRDSRNSGSACDVQYTAPR